MSDFTTDAQYEMVQITKLPDGKDEAKTVSPVPPGTSEALAIGLFQEMFAISSEASRIVADRYRCVVSGSVQLFELKADGTRVSLKEGNYLSDYGRKNSRVGA